MKYKCNTEHKCGSRIWNADIHLIKKTSAYYEAIIQSRGTRFHLIAGSYQNGHFLCVPSHGFGCELSQYSDTFWNAERICRHLNRVDTESLVKGICQLPKFDEVI